MLNRLGQFERQVAGSLLGVRISRFSFHDVPLPWSPQQLSENRIRITHLGGDATSSMTILECRVPRSASTDATMKFPLRCDGVARTLLTNVVKTANRGP